LGGDRDFDVVVFGATGFVGRLVAGYLGRHAPDGLRIGLAGRSEARLNAVRAELAGAASNWSLVLAESKDAPSLARLANAARVVVSTVGPYRRHGLALVEACATAGTHYADLAGELLFMRESIDRYDAVAAGRARESSIAAASIRSPPTSAYCCCTRSPRQNAPVIWRTPRCW
jgi:short subunit dehydrogenase-like uncharacterized protein